MRSVEPHLGTTTKADSRANWNAGFIRQAGEWYWGCRINPVFRWWCQEAPVSFHNDRTVAVRKTRERDARATAPPAGRRTCDTIVVPNPLNPFEHPSDTLRIPFGYPSDTLRTPCGLVDWSLATAPQLPPCQSLDVGRSMLDVGCFGAGLR